MRAVQKLPKPDVLAQNEHQWLEDFMADRQNATKRNRYRHQEIKATLRQETFRKCVYCESKLGHNTPGDVEHKIPTSKVPQLHFTWENLTLACTECNRRKNNYYEESEGFLDPYVDDVLQILDHHGPVVTWRAGDVRGEVFVGTLELCSESRAPLIARKIEKINQLTHVLERYLAATDELMKGLLGRQIRDMASPSSEFSAMVLATVVRKGFGHLLQ